MKKIQITLLVIIACIVMGIIDAVIQPGYAAKSVIKIVMFLLIPIIYGIINRKADIQKLVNKIISKVYGGYVDAVFIIPYTQGGIASLLQEKGIVEAVDYLEEGTQIKGRFHVAEINKYCEYIQK